MLVRHGGPHCWTTSSFCSSTNSTVIPSANSKPQRIRSRSCQPETKRMTEREDQRERRSLPGRPVNGVALVSDASHLVHVKAIAPACVCVKNKYHQPKRQKNHTDDHECFPCRLHRATFSASVVTKSQSPSRSHGSSGFFFQSLNQILVNRIHAMTDKNSFALLNVSL